MRYLRNNLEMLHLRERIKIVQTSIDFNKKFLMKSANSQEVLFMLLLILESKISNNINNTSWLLNGSSKELSHWDSTFEYQKHMLKVRNKTMQ